MSSSSSTSSSRFTFLATLFLLLFVSSAIILRSFLLRRRFQRRVQEAIAAGVLLSPEGGLVVRRRLEKPKLWDAFIASSTSAEWADIVPMAGRAAAVIQSIDTSATVAEDDSSRAHSWFPYFRPRPPARTASASPSITPAEDISTPERSQERLADVRAVEVALLVAMPSPHRNAEGTQANLSGKGKEKSFSGYWDDEEGVPDVVLGVTQVRFRHGDSGHEHVTIQTTVKFPSTAPVPAY